MLLLALDTATPAMTVALYDGERVLAEATTVDMRRHGELLAACTGEVLARAGAAAGDLSAVVAGVGPGPYTALRAGLVTARVLGSVVGAATYGVCSLDVIAMDVAGACVAGTATGAAGGGEFLVVTDARRREVYWARYSPAGERLSGPDVAVPAALPRGLPAAGAGALLYPGQFPHPVGPPYPAAATLARYAAGRLAAGLPLLPPEPLYLRRPDAREPGRPKAVTPVGRARGRP